jgi:hypothetical protein
MSLLLSSFVPRRCARISFQRLIVPTTARKRKMSSGNPFARLFGKKPSGTIATFARLAPGGPTGEINLTLATFDPATSAPYDCISYDRSRTWNTVDVAVDGKPMPIPLPLKQALTAFRHPKDTTLLWADLLTGSSAEERSKQAQVAKQVLENARSVTCFLGDANERSAEAYTVLQTMANWWKQGCLQVGFPAKFSMATQRNVGDMRAFLLARNLSQIRLEDKKLWQEIEAVVNSPYFKSAQAITDVILGNDVTVRSGAQSIRWEDFNPALRAMLLILTGRGIELSPAVAEAFQVVSSIDVSVQRAMKSESLELLPMIQSARDGSTFTDPREVVFSVLPVVTPSERVKLSCNKPQPLPVADYTKTTEQVYTEAAKYIIEERQDFLIWWNQLPPCRRKMRDLPSFVPDYSSPVPKSAFFRAPESGLRRWWDSIASPKRIFVDDESLLHVQAHALDRIVSVSPVFTEKNYAKLCLQMWQEGPRVPGEAAEQVMERYWRAIVLDTDSEFGERLRDNRKPGKEVSASWQSLICEQMILDHLKCTSEELYTSPELQARMMADVACTELGPATGQSARIEELILRNTLGRRMFKTSTGKVGMTAIEATDSTEDSEGPPVPNFDGALGDDLGRVMLEGFQSYLAQRAPDQAKLIAEAMQGKLPGQRAPGVRSGDLVAVLVGGFEPYILRPVKPETETANDLQADAKYTFVGDCHLQGAMDGECLVDPNDLYGGWKRVPLVDVLIA